MNVNNKKENKKKMTAEAIAEDAFHKAHAVITEHLKMIFDLNDSPREMAKYSCVITINLINTIFSKVAYVISDDCEEAFEYLKIDLIRNIQYRDYVDTSDNVNDTNNEENLNH